MSKEILNTVNKATHMIFVKITLKNGNTILRTNKAFNAKPTKAQAKKAAGLEVVALYRGKYETISGLEYGYLLAEGRQPVLSWDDLKEVEQMYVNPQKVKTKIVHKFF